MRRYVPDDCMNYLVADGLVLRRWSGIPRRAPDEPGVPSLVAGGSSYRERGIPAVTAFIEEGWGCIARHDPGFSGRVPA